MLKISKTIKILTILFIPYLISAQEKSGSLFIIGGGNRSEDLMKQFIHLVGGEDKKFIIIPMASGDPEEVGKEQKEEFENLGVKNVNYLLIDRISANSDSVVEFFNDVNGIFFSGGDQNKLTEIFIGSKVLSKIKQLYAHGTTLGGTSAGAAIMSKIMITGNEIINKDSNNVFNTIENGNIETAEGFGFIEDAIIDQHFIKRKRLNRLISVVLENPNKIGIGIDECTAIIVYPNKIFEVVGESQVVVFDATESSISLSDTKLKCNDLKVHILTSGDRYDLESKKIIE